MHILPIMMSLPTKTPRDFRDPKTRGPQGIIAIIAIALSIFTPSIYSETGSLLNDEETTRSHQKISELKKNTSTPNKVNALMIAGLKQSLSKVTYDPAYRRLAYPMGDVPAHTGVCTDVIIRAYRELGFDLQELVHMDMKKNFSVYPKIWGLKKPDSNIDHRRVPNLRVFLKRKGASLKVTDQAENYLPGDLITSTVPPNLPHIAIVVPSPDNSQPPWIVHNIGRGPKYENKLFTYPITGHYRWHPTN